MAFIAHYRFPVLDYHLVHAQYMSDRLSNKSYFKDQPFQLFTPIQNELASNLLKKKYPRFLQASNRQGPRKPLSTVLPSLGDSHHTSVEGHISQNIRAAQINLMVNNEKDIKLGEYGKGWIWELLREGVNMIPKHCMEFSKKLIKIN